MAISIKYSKNTYVSHAPEEEIVKNIQAKEAEVAETVTKAKATSTKAAAAASKES